MLQGQHEMKLKTTKHLSRKKNITPQHRWKAKFYILNVSPIESHQMELPNGQTSSAETIKTDWNFTADQ